MRCFCCLWFCLVVWVLISVLCLLGCWFLFECLFNWFGCVVGFGLGCWLWVGQFSLFRGRSILYLTFCWFLCCLFRY